MTQQVGQQLEASVSRFRPSDYTELSVDFPAFISTFSSNISLQITAPADHLDTYSLLRDLYESDFALDFEEGRLHIDLDYTLLHCDSCKQRGYTSSHPNCLAGGRYCLAPTTSELSAGHIFGRILINKCVERLLNATSDEGLARRKMMEYYWTLRSGCLPEDKQICTLALLDQRLGNITEQVKACVKDSFISQQDAEGHSVDMKLLDNSILMNTSAKFSKVKSFGTFPLIQVNGLVFTGQLTLSDLKSFLCGHLRGTLKGCVERKEVLVAGSGANAYKIAVVVFNGFLAIAVIVFCKQKLQHKFRNELTYKLDETVSSYLSRSDKVL